MKPWSDWAKFITTLYSPTYNYSRGRGRGRGRGKYKKKTQPYSRFTPGHCKKK